MFEMASPDFQSSSGPAALGVLNGLHRENSQQLRRLSRPPLRQPLSVARTVGISASSEE